LTGALATGNLNGSMLRPLAQVFRGLLIASAFFFFWAGAFVMTWTLCPVARWVVRDELRRWRGVQRIVKQAFRLFHGYMRALTLLEMRAVGPLRARPPGPLVMVANHPTLVDVTAILATYDDVCCVVKSSLMRSFFVGGLLRTCGHIDGGDGQAMSGAEVMREARRRLDAGMAVLIFPEGTRSPPGGMHSFRRGAFELAVRSGVPLWPLVMTCNPPALSKGLPFWKQPEKVARLRIEPAEALTLAGVAGARAESRSVEALFRDRLGIAPPGGTVEPARSRSHRSLAGAGLRGTPRDEASPPA
jgi:1-acyl-sn-glycerol-3-phosphate acyltransferase